MLELSSLWPWDNNSEECSWSLCLLASSRGVRGATGRTMDMEMFYDDHLSKQDHLYAWSAPKRSQGNHIRLCGAV